MSEQNKYLKLAKRGKGNAIKKRSKRIKTLIEKILSKGVRIER